MEALWKVTGTDIERYPALASSMSADIAIIGAGITGLTTALRLADAGLKVVVLEALTVGMGGTAGSTGNLYSSIAAGLAPLRKKWGDETVREVVAARAQAIDYIEATVNRFGIDCQFHRRSLYRIVPTDNPPLLKAFDEEYEAMRCAGLAVKREKESVLASFTTVRGLSVENQAQFNPLLYVQALARAVSHRGVTIFENSPVRSIDYHEGILKTDSGEVIAQHIVHATHTPKGINLLHTELIASREYGISARLNSGVYPEGIYFVHDPFHSIRSYRHGNEAHLIVVGEKHKTGEGEPFETYYQRLRDYLTEHFDVQSFDCQWSNQQYSPADGLPYIGKMHGKDKGYLATGFSGDGLVWGTLAGMIIGDLVLERDNPWHKCFDSRRLTPGKSAVQWAQENVSTARHLIKDYLGTGKLNEFNQIAPSEGRVVTYEGEKLALYRNVAGELFVLSAVCPHMKCVVHWNEAELSWDCPCHGSRFDTRGNVIEGPAYHPLVQRDPTG